MCWFLIGYLLVTSWVLAFMLGDGSRDPLWYRLLSAGLMPLLWPLSLCCWVYFVVWSGPPGD